MFIYSTFIQLAIHKLTYSNALVTLNKINYIDKSPKLQEYRYQTT